jgi:hypothetical protein
VDAVARAQHVRVPLAPERALTPRGAEHHQILDSFEGVKAADSTVATQLGEITSEIAESKDQAGYAGTAARLRVAAAVFGR